MSLIYATALDITLWARGVKVQVVPKFNFTGVLSRTNPYIANIKMSIKVVSFVLL